ncbi:hypothetical protein BpHYR1_040824 [Brachionus plicatilis]|uniref:Uncharacterized protein n=1 Tax=Brachionus plicatilis TaxID=10195 RepID=A0A3M7RZR9_BRAPC|nr:hypothetical protein BpHYR1_040824 [Brachionus plicatilis]
MCLTPTVTMRLGKCGFHLMQNILSLCPRVLASFSPLAQSHTQIEWLSSRPTEASFLPSAEKLSEQMPR